MSAAPPVPAENHRFHLLFGCLLIIGAGNSMLFALLPPLMRGLDLPDSSVGWIFSLSALLWVLTSPLWGRLSDRLGRKPIIALGLLAYAISMGAFAAVAGLGLAGFLAAPAVFAGLMLTRAIFGAFGSAASPAAQAYVADRTHLSQRTEELARLSAAFALGQALGPALTAMLAAKIGLLLPIVITSCLAACAGVAIWKLLPHEAPQTRPAPDAVAVGPFASVKLAADPRLAAFLLYAFGLSIATGSTAQIFALYVMDRLGVAGAQGAELAALGFMIGALALLTTQMAILPRLRLTPRMLMALGAGAVGLGLLLQIFSSNLGGLMVSQLVQGFGFGLARPGFTGGASMAVTPKEQGAAAGLVVAMNGAGFIFSPIVGGVAYETLGMNAPLLITLALLLAMSAFSLISRRLRGAH